jgi:hypothetical protein
MRKRDLRRMRLDSLERLYGHDESEPEIDWAALAPVDPEPAEGEPPEDRFCDANCTWLDHHPQCVRAESAATQPTENEPCR